MDIAALREAHPEHWRLAAAIRVLTLDAVAAAKSGHSGMPMGMADIATVLFDRHLKFDPSAPFWPDRDRFVVSNGHGSMLLYALLHLTGYPDMPMEEIRAFRQWESRTPGHPEVHHTAGVETTTGPLGQGLANAVGMAIAEEALRARFGPKVMDHRTWVFAGDGCLMEGISQEAISLAGMQRLGRLIVFFDDNGITIDGKVSLADATDQGARFAASGWHVQAIDGHDPDAIDAAIRAAVADPRPSMIACRTHIALGSAAQDTAKGHGALTDAQLIADTRAAYGWEHPPFEIPADIKARWEAMGERGRQARAEWEARLEALPAARRREFERVAAGEPPGRLAAAIGRVKQAAIGSKPVATRKSSEIVLEAVNAVMPETIGGSADLTGSNNTKTEGMGVFAPDNRKGRYIHWGIREHGMAAAMNGMALHGGVLPYGGTFLCFSDYARPAIRLSALMGAKVIYVMTHDSIGLGEDGPTHQPVEHLAALRAIPGLRVIRPADTVETAEAWEIALAAKGPTLLALSRQNLPPVRTRHVARNLSLRGAYILAEAEARRQAVLLATGSEVSVALAARERLEAEGIGTRVVSMPCMELFAEQEEAYRRRVLGPGAVRVAVEAAVRQGWDRWLLGDGGREAKAGFVGMTRFGASAPDTVLFERFGITPEAVAAAVRARL
ncbi:transketolase [Rubellimicrobium sp. CFH 75288]|uniref:transketolase n=1 Tax=Rubellimicrobium sp. CFH 75288 TaxID=2697034 RepID=UPI001412C2EF|nr:transketolase [Rubellimicrobium sp. CFH 75288]NAZ36035.1 transketolase [Rubellimicrobium sp. CFH 75288]